MEAAVRVEPHPFLKCGERVRIKRGALEGVEGILVRKSNRNRMVLSFDLLAQSVAVEIDAADVETAAARGLAEVFPFGRYVGIKGSQEAQTQ